MPRSDSAPKCSGTVAPALWTQAQTYYRDGYGYGNSSEVDNIRQALRPWHRL